MRVLGIALVAIALALAAGCGGDDDAPSEKHSAGEVIDLFEEETGALLARDPASPPVYEALIFKDSGLDDDLQLSPKGKELAEEYGAFTVYVAVDDKAVDGLLDGERDERGIYWERQTYEDINPDIPPSWGLSKRYGNVVLHYTGGEEKETDERFDRLDAILQELE